MKFKKPAKETKERRYFAVKELRIAEPSAESGGIGILEGYAAVYDSWSEDLGFFKERIKRGAFKSALKGSDCRALFNHDPSLILGRQSAGTLRLEEDGNGLFMSVDLPDTQCARDLVVSVNRGDITQQSFQFEVEEDEWVEDRKSGRAERTITRFKEVFDVSPVTFPAYTDTTVAKRSLDNFRSGLAANGDESEQEALDDEFDNFEMQMIEENIKSC